MIEPGPKWLFLFAHPDDEIAVAAWMRRCQGRAWWAHGTPVRAQESERVASRLNTEPLGFGDLPDRGFVANLDRLRTQVEGVIERCQPEVVATLSFEHGHPDHDALNWAARQAWGGPLAEIPMYRPAPVGLAIQSFALGDGWRIPLSAEESQLKWELTYAYPSQRLGHWLRLHARTLRARGLPAETLSVEKLRLQEQIDYLTPNAQPRTASKISRSRDWAIWINAVRGQGMPSAPLLQQLRTRP